MCSRGSIGTDICDQLRVHQRKRTSQCPDDRLANSFTAMHAMQITNVSTALFQISARPKKYLAYITNIYCIRYTPIQLSRYAQDCFVLPKTNSRSGSYANLEPIRSIRTTMWSRIFKLGRAVHRQYHAISMDMIARVWPFTANAGHLFHKFIYSMVNDMKYITSGNECFVNGVRHFFYQGTCIERPRPKGPSHSICVCVCMFEKGVYWTFLVEVFFFQDLVQDNGKSRSRCGRCDLRLAERIWGWLNVSEAGRTMPAWRTWAATLELRGNCFGEVKCFGPLFPVI